MTKGSSVGSPLAVSVVLWDDDVHMYVCAHARVAVCGYVRVSAVASSPEGQLHVVQLGPQPSENTTSCAAGLPEAFPSYVKVHGRINMLKNSKLT